MPYVYPSSSNGKNGGNDFPTCVLAQCNKSRPKVSNEL